MSSVFDLNDTRAYQQWRDAKLRDYPTDLQQLTVEVSDPLDLSEQEHQQLLALCRKANFVLYRSVNLAADKRIPVQLGRQFGLNRLDHNWLADADAVTSLQVSQQAQQSMYVPYTDRPINWHTDGYYNSPLQPIQGLILHCVHPAREGGENHLLDHDIAYITLRDADPRFIEALMQPDVMIIPPRRDEHGVARAEVVGPVFSVNPANGRLHMRYTMRSRSIEWKQDGVTQEALACLQALLDSDSPYIFKGLLESGMGLLSNNVLHDRTAFHDDPECPRLMYRARYYDAIDGTQQLPVAASA